jgi:hypothetical protein
MFIIRRRKSIQSFALKEENKQLQKELNLNLNEEARKERKHKRLAQYCQKWRI